MFKKKPLVLAIQQVMYNNSIKPREVMEQDLIAHINMKECILPKDNPPSNKTR